MPISTIAQATEVRAAFAEGTVKKRIRMCGSPAVPRTSASPSETKFKAPSGPWKSKPGRSRFDAPSATGTAAAAPKKSLKREAEVFHREHRQGERGHEQEAGFDDLHPRRRKHAAEKHVDQHQHADGNDADDPFGTWKQQIDNRVYANHLRYQVKEGDCQRGERGDGAHAAAAQPKRDEIGHRVLTDIAQRLRNEKKDR